MPFSRGADNVRIYYEDIGTGSPLVLVHGFAMSHSIWGGFVYELKQSHRVISVDLRGHGDSDKPSGGYEISTFAEDILTLIENLGLEGVAYLGWSAGASVGLKIASSHPEKIDRLILVGCSPCWGRKLDFPWGHQPELVDSWKKDILQNYPAWMYRAVELMFEKQIDEKTKLWMWNMGMRLPLHAAIGMINDAMSTDLRSDLRKIRGPTHIFHGAHDKMNYPEAAKYMASRIARCRVVVFPMSGHTPFIEEQDVFLKELKSSLSEA